jgi:hypothetical protein
MDKVKAGVEAAVQHLLDAFPGSTFRVISSLAEGAETVIKPAAEDEEVGCLTACMYNTESASPDQ